MDAREWDERYSGRELVWSATPNMFVEQILADAAPARMIDVAAGEGRNALWLASKGWHTTAVDFSPVGLARAERLATSHPDSGVAQRFSTLVADVTRPYDVEPADVVLICYLQIAWDGWQLALEEAVRHLAPGGMLLVITHDVRNVAEGYGGPQDPSLLQDPSVVARAAADLGLQVERAETVQRPVAEAPRPALDCLVIARR